VGVCVFVWKGGGEGVMCKKLRCVRQMMTRKRGDAPEKEVGVGVARLWDCTFYCAMPSVFCPANCR
jgi:hypothetical protein